MNVFARAVLLGLLTPSSVAMAEIQLSLEGGLMYSFGRGEKGVGGLYFGPTFDYVQVDDWAWQTPMRPTVGAALRTEWQFGERGRFAVSGRAGMRNARRSDSFAFVPGVTAVVESGIGIDTKGTPLWLTSLRTGFYPAQGMAQLSLGLREGLAVDDVSIGLGTHFGLFSPSMGTVSVGRPVRDEDGAAQLACGPSDEPWARRAREEHTAVVAFLNLALELRQVGAPSALIRRCLVAANQEIDHAMAAYRIASQHGQVTVRPLPLAPRTLSRTPETLARLAVESWLDGHDNEGAAAAQAQDAIGGSASVFEHDFWTTVAVEEGGHAKLGRSIARWAAQDGGSVVVRALALVS